MENYDPNKIEKKWQEIWEKNKYGCARDFDDKKKFYNLVEFPYPSGEGLHVGHCMGYTATDAYSRLKRMQGYNVMAPIGWDAFGLPTENFAIRTKSKPQDVTKKSIDTFRRQMKMMGYSFDWDREVNTTDPDYYRWTQWIFLEFYKHAIVDGKLVRVADDDKTTPRLAYQAEIPINWCPSCKIGLANEEVIAGRCERCGAEVVKKMQKQWMLRITAYAERLIEDLGSVDYPERVKSQQINWIGKSTGSEIDFKIKLRDGKIAKDIIKVYTTRADTLFGCTYVVLAPEHELVRNLANQIDNPDEVEEYQEKSRRKTDLERTELAKEKTGVELKGIKAINPINNEEIPIFIADYCLLNYGTGAVMAVPAHDERDFEFANKFGLQVKEVVEPLFEKIAGTDAIHKDEKYIERHPVVAVVKHWSEDKYLILKWKNTDWRGFVIGGIEDGEDEVSAATREIIEETGYQHPKFIKKLGGKISARFYQVNKNENRWAHFQPLYFELADGEQKEISEEEKKIHEIHWVEKNKVDDFLSWVADMKLIWHRAVTGDYYFGVTPSESVSADGILVNSQEFDGLRSEEAKKKITEKLNKIGAGGFATNYKLRDWVFSRQHYWGEPIPIIHCEKCGTLPVPEKDLPIILPEVEQYEPTNTGESPLAAIKDWVDTTCPSCAGKARRETDTMPNWAGSSWYFLRYCDPRNDKEFADRKLTDYWMMVDLYNGGMEHTTLHLLYSRFWHKFLYDLKKVRDPEPYAKRVAHGIILGPDHQKMSKSRGNVINPDTMVKDFGADTLRAYIMFIGPYSGDAAWNMAGIQGVFRFLKRVWAGFELVKDDEDAKEVLEKVNRATHKITLDLENFEFNTVISELMETQNTIEKAGHISKKLYQIFLKLLFPACPHIAEELWEKAKFEDTIEENEWPKADEKFLSSVLVQVAVQFNGKTKGTVGAKPDARQDEVEHMVKQTKRFEDILKDKTIIKVIYVPGRVINFVVKE